MSDDRTTESPTAAWHISTHSANGGGSCVEAGPYLDGTPRRAVRDSTRRHAGTLTITSHAWTAFLTAVRH